MSEYDVVVIGGGAAGLSASLVLSRAGRRILVVDSGSPRNAPAEHMHGYLSRDGLAPTELLAIGRDGGDRLRRRDRQRVGRDVRAQGHLGLLGAAWPTADVSVHDGCSWPPASVMSSPTYPVSPTGGRATSCTARTATATRCATSSSASSVDSSEAVQYAQIVRQWSHDVVYFTPPDMLSRSEREQLTARAIGIVEGTVERIIVDEDRLTGVALDGDRTVPRDAVFVPPRFIPNNDLLIALGCQVDDARVGGQGRHRRAPPCPVCGWPATSPTRAPRSSRPRAKGSTAAIAINADLVEDDVRDAVQHFNQDLVP